MQGRVFTYSECEDAIMRLVPFLEASGDLEWHPAEVNILDDNFEKIRIIGERFPSEEVNIGFEGAPPLHLFFQGWFWPTRRLSEAEVRTVFSRLISEDLTHNPQELVQPWSHQEYVSQNVHIEINTEPQGIDIYPHYTYDDLGILMQKVLDFFQARGQWGPLRGKLTNSPGTWGGFLDLQPRFDVGSNATALEHVVSLLAMNTSLSAI